MPLTSHNSYRESLAEKIGIDRVSHVSSFHVSLRTASILFSPHSYTIVIIKYLFYNFLLKSNQPS